MSTLPSLTTSDFNRTLDALREATIDFDRIFDQFDNMFPLRRTGVVAYPPTDIIKTEDGYVISMAVAGFSKDDITVEVDRNRVIIVTGMIKAAQSDNNEYLYKGIATRQFTRKWKTFETDTVKKVTLKDGLLTIEIERQPPSNLDARTKIEIQ